jgi:hypothetical protein
MSYEKDKEYQKQHSNENGKGNVQIGEVDCHFMIFTPNVRNEPTKPFVCGY